MGSAGGEGTREDVRRGWPYYVSIRDLTSFPSSAFANVYIQTILIRTEVKGALGAHSGSKKYSINSSKNGDTLSENYQLKRNSLFSVLNQLIDPLLLQQTQ